MIFLHNIVLVSNNKTTLTKHLWLISFGQELNFNSPKQVVSKQQGLKSRQFVEMRRFFNRIRSYLKLAKEIIFRFKQ